MTVREGSLEAPTRHPIDWQNPEYYDKGKAFAEMERVFDICHGCRRCVSLCASFPTLFDLVDESSTMEVDGVKKEDYWKVVDQCYLCDVCYMTKCPYVPPHPWNVDFPHLMLRAKAIQHREGTPHKWRDTQLSSTDRNGKLATIPVVVQFVNAAAKMKPMRALGEKVLGVDKDAWLPEFAAKPFRKHALSNMTPPVKDGTRTPGKVAIFSTCYMNYNEPGIGHDLLKVLDHNSIAYEIVEKEACCGMPKLEQGDLDAVAALKDKNVPVLARYAREGYAILTPIPSCTLMFKQELPLMFPADADLKAIQEAMFDPFEYLVLRNKDGLLKNEFPTALGKVSYHIPCHSRVQNVGQKTREALELVPGTEVKVIERCSGHAGTYGVKKEYHATAMKIGRPVFRQVAEFEPNYFSSDCALAGHHIEQGLGEDKKNAQLKHPLTLLRMAYGLPD
ncbi:Anaerobic glycerol-3-phosphate dehydrogenase subunit C [Usitatibacter rugosus]|uniref:Anaerobic glycerol-3-phosphate dehydrogenase subunit C n=1 Tax=Usitatibacter rugosus TaxID=2732067 RepID=A0A6M4GYH8_9PROT|nr:heterodisulfide reductase-related iron-sulfur binding cluster [Usitatibacter rugosus]QJR10577.1 Anaerobic glycerol-3-phosphate dehydrogenase subunit C [Usitatibacter rugosus]